MIIFIDESGCLGFDWNKPGTSNHLVLTALVCDHKTQRLFDTAVKRTLRNKINRKAKRPKNELKGSDMTLPIKQYFYRQIANKGNWSIYTVILNKHRVYNHLTSQHGKHKLYNFMVSFLIEQIPFASDLNSATILIDKSKNSNQRKDFNQYIRVTVEKRAGLSCDVHLYHPASHDHSGLQVVDLFCWGIARKHEGDNAWFDSFSEKVAIEKIYLPE